MTDIRTAPENAAIPPALASPPAMTAALWGQLFLLGLLWGGSFFFVSVAVAEVPPLTLVLMRVAIAALALNLWLAARGGGLAAHANRFAAFLGLGLLNNAIPFSLMFAGQTAIGAGLASILNATTPIWTILIANALTADERLSWNKAAGVVLGLCGVAALIGPDALTGLGAPLWAQFALVGTAISYGFAAVFARRFKNLPAPVTATGQLTASTLIMLPVALIVDGSPSMLAPSTSVLAAIVALGLLSTAFAYILYFRIIAAAGATNAALVTLLVPASAILLGAAFLGERLGAGDLAGMALIGLGLLVIDGRLVKQLRRV